MDIEQLLAQYWELAYHEGKTGESRGTEAGAVLHAIRQALKAAPAEAVKVPNRNIRSLKRISDQSMEIVFYSCRAASEFYKQLTEKEGGE